MDKGFIVKLTNDCNLRCPYCYHFANFANEVGYKNDMSLDILEKTIQALLSYNENSATFVWHGGEPLLRDINVFYKIVEWQKKYNIKGLKIKNCIQTNGILLSLEYIRFFIEYDFKVGISLDGFKDLYIANRRCSSKQFDKIISNLHLMQKSKMKFGIICVVSNNTVKYVNELFDFFVAEKLFNVAFAPQIIVHGRDIDYSNSISAKNYETFLVKFFDLWSNCNTEMRVREFDEYLRGKLSVPHKLCVNADNCANYLTISPDGFIYLCDSFPMTENWRLGTIIEPLEDTFKSEKYISFKKKVQTIPADCIDCKNSNICNGGCKYKRWLVDESFSEPQFMCKTLKAVYNHMDKKVNDLL